MDKVFERTSDALYDRHQYKLVLSNGESEIYDCYEEVQVRWFQTPDIFLSHVEVLDRKKHKGKGFS